MQDGVFQRLRHALMTGRFEPGQTLTIAFLAESFAVSQMPVREALRRLAAVNALEVGANGSSSVPTVSRARLDDLCRARIAVEGLATELGAENFSADSIRALRRNIDAHEALESGDVYDMLIKNREFHFALYEASGSEVLIQIIETLWLRFGPYMRLLTRHMEPQLTAKGSNQFTRRHRAVVEALERKDAAGAREEIIEDIRATQRLLHKINLGGDPPAELSSAPAARSRRA